MPRGLAPRRPARTGRQDKVGTGAPFNKVKAASDRPARGKVLAPKARQTSNRSKAKPASSSVARVKGYNPVAPERVAEILKRLDQMYPAVTCALTHASAWELVVATILSAQSTDVNVNRV